MLKQTIGADWGTSLVTDEEISAVLAVGSNADVDPELDEEPDIDLEPVDSELQEHPELQVKLKMYLELKVELKNIPGASLFPARAVKG